MDEATNQITAAADSEENPEQIRAEIEDTRAEMSQTINEIQERLSPDHLMGQVKETVRDATIGKVERVVETVGETISDVTEPAREVAALAGNAIKEVGTTVADKIWKNPIPVTLIGLGVGMLVVRNFWGDGTKTSSSRTSLPNRRTNYELGDVGNVGQPRQTLQSTGASTLNQVKETASDLASRAKDSASSVGTRFGELCRENPLAVGAVAVAAGTAVGLMLPSTQLESEYIGETGEKLVESVEDVARDALGKVQDAAKQMAPGQERQQQQQQPPA
ncbi:MAG TPA: DUF3618 domain-containing protein [Pyrinomonadaceae bacterium]|nr:DUF3618 domain-containing protein [Pyrinomonadaceae bacterium]